MPSLSAAAFRASVRDRLKTEAKKCGRPVKELQREFVLQRFLARVFAAADSPGSSRAGLVCSSGCPASATAKISIYCTRQRTFRQRSKS